MADYTPQIDSQIAQMLKLRGVVTPDMISGVPEEEARGFLQMYVNSHADEQLNFDGTALTGVMPSLAEEPAPQAAMTDMSMDTNPGYGAPSPEGYGTPDPVSDLVPREEPSGWLWLLPIIFLWIGGIGAWAIAKDKNSQTARNMLITGVALTVLWACMGFGLGIFGGGLAGSTPADASWPATGRVTFYYFGSPG